MAPMCTLVVEDNGQYQQHPNAEVEDWDEVRAEGEVEFVEDLIGWRPYTVAYRVTTWRGDKIYYFVADAQGGA